MARDALTTLRATPLDAVRRGEPRYRAEAAAFEGSTSM